MDVRLSPEQTALRDAAAQIVDRFGVHVVAQLTDDERATRLDAVAMASGWSELRSATEEGSPLASAVEVAVVAEELGRGLADAAFLGPTMALELRRLAGAPESDQPETIALRADLSGAWSSAVGATVTSAVAIDARCATSALGLLDDGGGGYALGVVPIVKVVDGVDLTRPSAHCGYALTRLDGHRLGPDDLARWHSLGLAITCADLVGVMRGALDLATDYARSRHQYGAAIGSYQAVQYLLADALVATEGSRSIALHAAWSVDARESAEAFAAASAAKAYCARAARWVCESAIQVHGGIGNTWDCLAHLYLRRALLSGECFGGVGASLDRVLSAHGVGGDHGLR